LRPLHHHKPGIDLPGFFYVHAPRIPSRAASGDVILGSITQSITRARGAIGDDKSGTANQNAAGGRES
jgi:hypothetical protein